VTRARPLAVVALGGNVLLRPDDAGDVGAQRLQAAAAAAGLVSLLRDGADLLVVHGNGPQVGNALLRAAAAASTLPPPPLDVAVAATAGEIGYLLAEALDAELAAARMPRPVAAVVTRVVVDAGDPSFARPTKPVGPFYDAETAAAVGRARGWRMAEDAGRGWRQVVPSPPPRQVVEIEALRVLLAAGCVVVAGGGGGVPVAPGEGGVLAGVEGVVDKDRTAALLARELGADLLVILTGVDRVIKNFGRKSAQPLPALGLRAALRLHARGQFPSGSMGPKIEAAMAFVAAAGRPALITSPQGLAAATRGESGTYIVPDAMWLRGGPWGLPRR
jgi:carbamate kinase